MFPKRLMLPFQIGAIDGAPRWEQKERVKQEKE
jgi:hypothetical protein